MRLSVFALLAALTASTSALATPADDARSAAITAFSTCAVARNADAARAFVMGSAVDVAANQQVINASPACARTAGAAIANLAASGATLKQALANALVSREFARFGPTDFSAIARISSVIAPIPASESQLAAMSDADRIVRSMTDQQAATDYIMAQLGECIARLKPEGVRALSQTVTGTPAERTAVVALNDEMAACLQPGTSLRLRAPAVRAWAVLQYYRLAHTEPTLTPTPSAAPAGGH